MKAVGKMTWCSQKGDQRFSAGPHHHHLSPAERRAFDRQRLRYEAGVTFVARARLSPRGNQPILVVETPTIEALSSALPRSADFNPTWSHHALKKYMI